MVKPSTLPQSLSTPDACSTQKTEDDFKTVAKYLVKVPIEQAMG